MDRFADNAWFAGFADGEASFVIKPSRYGYQPAFQLALRLDDAPILEALRLSFGGFLSVTSKEGSTSRPQCHWHVTRKAHMAGLVRYFDAFPLRAKKARDYIVWREAVNEYIATSCASPRLAVLRTALHDGRRYDAGEPPPIPERLQLRLVEDVA